MVGSPNDGGAMSPLGRTLVASLAVTCASRGLNAQAREHTCTEAGPAIRRLLQTMQEKERNVGLSAAIMHHGRLVYSEGLGFADLEHRVPVTPRSLFTVASTGKAFTGTTLAILADSGVIDLDAPIQRYLPAYHPPGSDSITLRLLAAHLGGVRHYRPAERTAEFLARHVNDVMDVVAMVAGDSLVDQPGRDYHYSSYGYNLIAAAIQAATHRPFATVVADLIFRPLGLRDTRFDDVRYVVERRVRHYAFNDPITYAPSTELRRVPDFDYSYNMGGGNILTTAEDLVRFGQAVMRPGRLSPGALRLVQSEIRGTAGGTNWGLGWFVNPDSAGRKRVHINGAFVGVQSALYVFPDDEIAVAVIANTWGIGAVTAEMATTLPSEVAQACRDAPRR